MCRLVRSEGGSRNTMLGSGICGFGVSRACTLRNRAPVLPDSKCAAVSKLNCRGRSGFFGVFGHPTIRDIVIRASARMTFVGVP